MLIGLAIAKQVHATATTRTRVLTARLIAFSLHAGPLGAETLLAGIISLLSSGRGYSWEESRNLCHFDTARYSRSLSFRCFCERPINHMLEHRDKRFRFALRLKIQKATVLIIGPQLARLGCPMGALITRQSGLVVK